MLHLFCLLLSCFSYVQANTELKHPLTQVRITANTSSNCPAESSIKIILESEIPSKYDRYVRFAAAGLITKKLGVDQPVALININEKPGLTTSLLGTGDAAKDLRLTKHSLTDSSWYVQGGEKGISRESMLTLFKNETRVKIAESTLSQCLYLGSDLCNLYIDQQDLSTCDTLRLASPPQQGIQNAVNLIQALIKSIQEDPTNITLKIENLSHPMQSPSNSPLHPPDGTDFKTPTAVHVLPKANISEISSPPSSAENAIMNTTLSQAKKEGTNPTLSKVKQNNSSATSQKANNKHKRTSSKKSKGLGPLGSGITPTASQKSVAGRKQTKNSGLIYHYGVDPHVKQKAMAAKELRSSQKHAMAGRKSRNTEINVVKRLPPSHSQWQKSVNAMPAHALAKRPTPAPRAVQPSEFADSSTTTDDMTSSTGCSCPNDEEIDTSVIDVVNITTAGAVVGAACSVYFMNGLKSGVNRNVLDDADKLEDFHELEATELEEAECVLAY